MLTDASSRLAGYCAGGLVLADAGKQLREIRHREGVHLRRRHRAVVRQVEQGNGAGGRQVAAEDDG
jgi:hypothetical protein